MAVSEQQSLSDKKYQYYGSNRTYYSGITIGSTSAWTFIDFSGTNTGFGATDNLLSQRISFASSGTSFFQWMYRSGTAMNLGGELWGGNTITKDGVNVSGVWVRSNAATQKFQITAW